MYPTRSPENAPKATSINDKSSGLDLEASVPLEEQLARPSPRNIDGIRWYLVVIGILSSIFLYSLDNTIVADITPAAVETLGNALNLPWLSVGFLLGGSAVVLPFGKLYGLFDAKWLYLGSSILFNVGSAVCGAAPSTKALIVGRVIAGMGGNGMYLGVTTLLSVNTLDKERPLYLSFVGLVWGIGTVLGPVIGGAFVESSATWRWAFYINLIVAAVFMPVYLFWIPSFKPRAGTRMTKLVREFDGFGSILSICAIMALIMAINFGGAVYPWSSGRIIALFVISGALFIVFGIQQGYTFFTSATNRIFPVHFLRNTDAVLLYICASAVNAAGFVPIYYIPLYFQFTRGDTAIDSAIRLLPLIFFLSATILASGRFMSRLSYFQPWYILGSVFALIGGVFLSRISSNTSVASIYGFEILVGVGTGAFIQAGYAVIQAITPPTEIAYAISFMMIAQLGGIALGLSIAGAVFVNGASKALTDMIPDISATNLQLLLSGASGSCCDSLSEELRTQAVEIIVSNLAKVFIIVYTGAAVALVASMLFKQRSLFKGTVAISA